MADVHGNREANFVMIPGQGVYRLQSSLTIPLLQGHFDLFGKSCRRPRPPMHGIVAVLLQIGTGLVGKQVLGGQGHDKRLGMISLTGKG